MTLNKRYSFKKIIFTTIWLIVGVGTIVLLVAGVRKKDAAKCKDVKIKISGIEKINEPKFVDEQDVINTIALVNNANPISQPLSNINLNKIEAELKKSKWIKTVQLFFDDNDVLNVSILERDPIARIFTNSGSSFYIDTSLTILPLSQKFSARLPMFTGFTTDNIVLSAKDSSLLNDIKNISMAIQKKSFTMAMIDQVDITGDGNFEMIPKVGKQIILLGNANDINEKFNKLELFYKNVLTKSGWNKYSTINLQYKNQIVAKLWGAEDKAADSVKTLQIMQLIAANAAKQAADSIQTFSQDNNNNTSDSSIILQSIQRDDNTAPTNDEVVSTAPVKALSKPLTTVTAVSPKPIVVKPPVTNNNVIKKNANKKIKKTLIVKPINKQKIKTIIQKPKVIMQPKNDY